MKKKTEFKIKKWLESVINHDIDQYEHWHIDDFDPTLKENPSKWISSSIEMLYFAYTQLEQLKKQYNLYLAIFLKPKKKSQNINFEQISDIEKELRYSPPALYLFEKNPDQFFFNKVKHKELTLNHIEGLNNKLKSSYSEYFDGEEYSYSLWFKVKSKNT